MGQDLLRTLFVLGLIDDNTPMDKQITLMYLLNRGSLSFYAHNQVSFDFICTLNDHHTILLRFSLMIQRRKTYLLLHLHFVNCLLCLKIRIGCSKDLLMASARSKSLYPKLYVKASRFKIIYFLKKFFFYRKLM